MQTESFVKPEGKTLQNALEFTKLGFDGAEIYTFLSINKNSIPEGVIWCCEKQGKTVSVLYNNGDMTVTKESGKAPYPGIAVMKYNSPSPEKDADVIALSQRDALNAYKIISDSKKLSPENEERYVYRARLMREGISLGFGIKKEAELVSFSFITAQNEDSAIIGDVFTLPEHRNRGYAKKCVLSAVRTCLEMKKDAYVLCEEEMTGFYGKLGFCLIRNSECVIRN